MQKLILMSVLIAMFWIPIALAARYTDLKRGARKVQVNFLIFCAIYAVSVLYIMPRL